MPASQVGTLAGVSAGLQYRRHQQAYSKPEETVAARTRKSAPTPILGNRSSWLQPLQALLPLPMKAQLHANTLDPGCLFSPYLLWVLFFFLMIYFI